MYAWNATDEPARTTGSSSGSGNDRGGEEMFRPPGVLLQQYTPQQFFDYETLTVWRQEENHADISAPYTAAILPLHPTGSRMSGAVEHRNAPFPSKKTLTTSKQSSTMTMPSMEGSKPI